MNKSIKIPIAAAKRFGQKYKKDQVIIMCLDRKTGKTWITTWGKSIKDCELAAISGNRLKRWIGWPEKLCHSTPSRLKKKGISL